MTRHGPFQSRHAVTALPAFRPLAPATSSATLTLVQTAGLAQHPWPRFFPSAASPPATAHPAGQRTDQPTTRKPLSP